MHMDAGPGWELYRSFLGVCREGSLSAAAGVLDLTQPTVGRHIDALESALGIVLFTRSPQGFRPTDAAEALRPYAESLEAAAMALLRTATGHATDVSGPVRITASEMVATEVLPPMLVRLQRAHPRLQVELVATNRVEDLLNREADIAVRMVRPAQQALVARRAGDIELGLFAHREYLAGRPVPKRVEDLQGHALIGFDREDASARSLMHLLGPVRRKSFTYRTDSHLAGYAALRAGAGIGICQVPLAHRHPDLARLLPRQVAPKMETWVTMHSDLRTSPRCRVTFDALVEDLAAYCRS